MSSNRNVIATATVPAAARAVLRKIVALPHHVFWADDIRFADSDLVDEDRLVAYRQVTDAHLLAIARRHDGYLATFAKGIRELLPREAADAVHLVT